MASRAKNKGKQYEHKNFLHDEKGHMESGGLSRHEGSESGYKRPDEHGHDNKFQQFGEE